MSIWIRKKRALDRAAREEKARKARRPKPVLEALSLPEDVSGNSVRVILLGDRCALVENHLGVAEIGREEIRLVTRRGVMTFRGPELRLTDVREGALTVSGQIEAVLLPSAGRGESGVD